MSFLNDPTRKADKTRHSHKNNQPLTAKNKCRLEIEQLEKRELMHADPLLDFGTTRSPVETGYTRVSVSVYNATRGFGWDSTSGLSAYNYNNVSDALTSDGHRGTNRTFLADLDNGTYEVTALLGDARTKRDRVSIFAEGQQVASNVTTNAGQFIPVTFQVTVNDGQLNLRFQDSGGANPYFSLAALEIAHLDPAPGDTTAPTVQLTAPAAGATVSGTVTITATASDNVGVAGVQFFLDGQAIAAEDTSAPYSLSWNTTTATNGSHTLTARARDAAGNFTTSAAVSVSVFNDTTAPTVQISGPSAGTTLSGSVSLTATASDDVGVVGVQFFVDGQAVGSEDTTSPYSFSWNTANVTNGSHTLTARARDAAGNTTTSSAITVTVSNDTTAPTVEVSGPASGASISGTVNVTATASDNVGVVGVQFFLDGVAVESEDTTSPFAYSWNTATAANGTHTLTARARDAAGNTTTSSAISVTVANDSTAPTVQVTAPGVNATVSGTVNVTATASDNVGVVGVQFFLDGQALGSEDTSSPYSFSWNTATATNGSHTLTARARDAAGNVTTSSPVAVTVSNSITVTFPNNVNVPPLPAPSGSVINVSTESQLRTAIANLRSGDTIMIAAGTYNLTDSLFLPQNLSNVSIRGATGRASDVIIKGNGMAGTVRFGFWVGNVNGVTFGDFTLRDIKEHGFILNAGVESPLVHNVHMIDIGDQFVKANPDGSGGGVDNGIVEYSILEYSTTAPDYYTNGVDVHTGQNWIIRNNVFKNFRSADALTGPAVLVWNSSSGTITEGNTFINNERDISYGLVDVSGGTDHSGGIIRNNFITRTSSIGGDVAIGVIDSPGTQVLHNSLKLNGDYPNAVEYRFANTTGVQILNNLTDAAIVARDSAQGTVSGNVTNAQSSWFVNAGIGDLHLTSSATAAIDKVLTLANASKDYDGQTRPSSGSTADIGADEYEGTAPAPDTTAPSVQVTVPASGATVSGTVTVAATASDNVGVVGVQFYLDGQALGSEDTSSPYSVSWNTTTATNGSHTLTARARDAAGNVTTSSTVTITVSNDVTAPTVQVTAPSANATVSGTVNVTASASDNVGVAGVQFFLDGQALGSEDTTSPYSFSWNTTTATNGSHTLTARARDAAGNTATSSAITVSVSNSTQTPTGLIAAYGFNDATGTTLADASGNTLNGTISGATWSTAGKFGGALSFDGVNDWVTINDNDLLDLTTGMTLEAWVNPTTINGWETVVLKEAGTDLAYALYADNYGNDTGGPRRPTVSIRQSGTTYFTTGTAQLATNTWTHLATTYDGAMLRLYINGVQVSSLARTGPINTSGNALRIGGNSVWSEWFNGLIDEVRIYNRALSASEIQSDMNTAVAPAAPDNTAPTVTLVSPASGATNVNTGSNIDVTFSESMLTSSLNSTTIQLRDSGGNTIATTVSWNAATKTATLDPNALLANSTTYTVVAKSGSAGVKDLAGNALATDYTWSFTTAAPAAAPVANAGADKTANEGAAVSFSGSASGGEGTLTYSWNFGDNSTGTGQNASHAYADNGTYTVTLTVTDSLNRTSSDTLVVTVSNVSPTATFTDNNPVAPGQAVTISFGSQLDPSSTDTTAGFRYSYDFNNDGTWDLANVTNASTTYTFNAVGNYTVKGSITDKDGGVNVYTTVIEVAEPGSTANLPLLTQSNLQYVGAFRLPTGTIGSSTFAYGGTAIAFNPANNSLFVVGHDWDQAIAEVSIPSSIVNSSNRNSLATASVKQSFSSVLSRIPDYTLTGNVKIGGLMVVNNQLIGTAYEFYDAEGNAVDSHFKLSSLSLSTAQVSGLYQVGSLGGGYVGGYMSPIPTEWQSAFGAPYLTGQAALSIISRTSSGPAAFGFDPSNLGASTTPITPYVYYPLNNPLGQIDAKNDYFTGTTEIKGVFFAPESRSVLFFGSNGTNTIGYGEGADFNDSNRPAKGFHSQNGDYRYQIWAYDANDFVAVKNGQKQPWDLRPYGVWPVNFPIDDGGKYIGGVAFDAATGRLYVSQKNADTDGWDPYPLIQVYQLSVGNALTAARVGSDAQAPTVTQQQADTLLAEALRRWQAAGVNTASLGTIEVRIADLGGAKLAQASGNTIWIDINAAGNGWFVDTTANDDSEFVTEGDQGEQGRMDLLTALTHEVGHLLGFDHQDGTVMDDSLELGYRFVKLLDS